MHRSSGARFLLSDRLRKQGNIAGLFLLTLVAFFLVSQTLLHNLIESIGDEEQLNAAATRGGLERLLTRKYGSFNKKLSSSLRSRFEVRHPPSDKRRVLRSVEELRVPDPATHLRTVPSPYNVYECPETPPPGYPHQFRLVDQLLKDWSVDDTDIPSTIYQSICVFDWGRDFATALRYRNAEVPFVISKHPELLLASERWNSPGYMRSMIGSKPTRTEYSKNNHLLFWRKPQGRRPPKGWEPPEVEVKITFDEFLEKAEALERLPAWERPGKEHYYFRLNGAVGGPNAYLFDELPIFRPSNASTFFMVRPEQGRGLNCRLGSRGSIAEQHFDPMRNFAVVMKGQRRYIISHPSQCANAELYPYGHPSCRHSSMNFSSPPGPDYRGPFRSMLASEIVLQPGDALYIPDSWLHFIVVLSQLSYQCNARSGLDENPELAKIITDCGFSMYAFPETARYFPELYDVKDDKSIKAEE